MLFSFSRNRSRVGLLFLLVLSTSSYANLEVNPYEFLGVARDASKEQIQAAYRKLAKANHPDATGAQKDKDREWRFRQATEAQETLIHPSKRAAWDRAHPVRREAEAPKAEVPTAREAKTNSHAAPPAEAPTPQPRGAYAADDGSSAEKYSEWIYRQGESEREVWDAWMEKNAPERSPIRSPGWHYAASQAPFYRAPGLFRQSFSVIADDGVFATFRRVDETLRGTKTFHDPFGGPVDRHYYDISDHVHTLPSRIAEKFFGSFSSLPPQVLAAGSNATQRGLALWDPEIRAVRQYRLWELALGGKTALANPDGTIVPKSSGRAPEKSISPWSPTSANTQPLKEVGGLRATLQSGGGLYKVDLIDLQDRFREMPKLEALTMMALLGPNGKIVPVILLRERDGNPKEVSFVLPDELFDPSRTTVQIYRHWRANGWATADLMGITPERGEELMKDLQVMRKENGDAPFRKWWPYYPGEKLPTSLRVPRGQTKEERLAYLARHTTRRPIVRRLQNTCRLALNVVGR